ncbi:MAG: Hsp20/alpha crystallin family protein [Candidatus Thorarchaeota archaeon]|nr:Hsp20/alpha crystallin family protein [Candidatus Thorarchaeota archaeon]
MSWDDPFDSDDPRKAIRKWFGDFLPEGFFAQIDELMDQMMREMDEGSMFDMKSIEDFIRENPEGTNPFVFGFSMRMGPDGKPIIQRFGNTPAPDGIRMTPELEPLVDVIEEGDEIVVVAELPGVSNDEIKIRVKGKELTIKVENPEKPYNKTLNLPAEVSKEDAKSTIRNGVLEIRLKKQ